MSENSQPQPQDDAERIRLKRIAKLQQTSSASTPASASPPGTPALPAQLPQPKPKPIPAPTPKRTPEPPKVEPTPIARKPRASAAPPPFDLQQWESETIGQVLKVTLDAKVCQDSGYDIVWLKGLAEELAEEEPMTTQRLHAGIADRVLISRLELDPQGMSDDLEYLPVLASLPSQQTVFEYLVGCWKRNNAARTTVTRKGYTPVDTQNARAILDKLGELLISYAGLILQMPDMFPQPQEREVSPSELVTPLVSLSALSGPLLSTATTGPNTLSPGDIPGFLQDLARRFEPDGELASVLGPVARGLLFHESLARPEGLGGGDAGWRGVVGGLEALVSVKPIAGMLTTLDEWCPETATASTIERVSLMGPLCRLGVFGREWPNIPETYFSEPEKRTRQDVESSYASLRGTLKSLQSSLFQVFNTIVRAGPGPREAVLKYFARVIQLNGKRAGMQVDPETVATDSFMVNLQSVLFHFAEPFMDAKYSKMDRIDPLYFAHSSRIDLKEETRINATSAEANEWAQAHQAAPDTPPPNFISDIFYLTLAMAHYGFLRTVAAYDDSFKNVDEFQRHLDMLEGDGSWRGSPLQGQVEHAIQRTKDGLAKIRAEQFAYQVQLHEPELVFRSVGFINFVSTWLIRQVDPKSTHPYPTVDLPLPKEVPMNFRILPEYIVEDIADFLHFVVRNTPDSLELSGKHELVVFALTFLTSTWYIKNPFLKAKVNETLMYGVLSTGRDSTGPLGYVLNSDPIALKHLMPALMHFYIEVEQTGASTQFYDKFNARRNIAYILKVIWNNPVHREALKNEAKNVDKFVRFVNLMINDVTYLMDESLSELTQIHTIQTEMANVAEWAARPAQQRREREGTLRNLERHASSYILLGKSTVNLLKIFTQETKEPFMMPEIVDRLAAMLDYNLVALVGPKCNDLRVKNPEKYKFEPRVLLSDIIQVYLNLSDQGEFARAVAADGRSYSKELFERTARIAIKRGLKTEQEAEQLLLFCRKVEETKATIEAEEDLGEIPDEFLDPLMYTVMRDPVILPSSKTVIDRSTIKSHLLSDTTDPFNRVPLSIEDVIPNPELKAQIEAFMQERRNKNTAYDKPADEVVKMDEFAD